MHYIHWSIQSLLVAAALVGAMTVVRPAQDTPRVIEITAKRFEFVPATIDVQQGERVILRVQSADRMHGFGIEKFGINREIPRGGDPVDIPLVASEAGTFPILCTEDCGRGHDDMTGTLVVKAVAP